MPETRLTRTVALRSASVCLECAFLGILVTENPTLLKVWHMEGDVVLKVL